jgi:hypothetical protein
MDNHSKFWLLFWLMAFITIIITSTSTAYFVSSHDTKMAEAGYVQKVIVIGNPNDTYNRRVETVWVKAGTEPVVESR